MPCCLWALIHTEAHTHTPRLWVSHLKEAMTVPSLHFIWNMIPQLLHFIATFLKMFLLSLEKQRKQEGKHYRYWLRSCLLWVQSQVLVDLVFFLGSVFKLLSLFLALAFLKWSMNSGRLHNGLRQLHMMSTKLFIKADVLIISGALYTLNKSWVKVRKPADSCYVVTTGLKTLEDTSGHFIHSILIAWKRRQGYCTTRK